jgi:hypothetical protein
VVKKDITPGTVPGNKEREEQKRRLTSSTSTKKRKQHMKEAKLKAVEWP